MDAFNKNRNRETFAYKSFTNSSGPPQPSVAEMVITVFPHKMILASTFGMKGVRHSHSFKKNNLIIYVASATGITKH